MAVYQKEYELLHDIHKITLPKYASYDAHDQSSILHDPQLEAHSPVALPRGLYPPKNELMQRMDTVFGNPWNAPHVWARDGYIEDSLLPNEGKVSDKTVIFCIVLFLAVVFGLFYMVCRLLSNGWCRYRKGRAIQEAKGVHAWGRWIDSVCMRMGGKRPTYHWERFAHKRMQGFPV